MTDYRRLDVWKAAHQLTLELYRATTSFPHHEQFGLTSQLRRAAVSVGANIAEGSARGDKEFARFLIVALGSANEVEYLLLVASDLGYTEGNEFMSATGTVGRMLVKFRRAVLARATTTQPNSST